jgi:hypothetical protein
MRRLLTALGIAAAACASAAPAPAAVPVDGTPYDLAQRADVRVTGAAGDALGSSVAAAGDVNGDGLADVILGAPGKKRAVVVLGSRTRRTADAAKLGTRGWTISGASIGSVVAGVGDVNADGVDDVAVGSDAESRAWVVFGSRTRRNVNLAKLGANGFRIDGGEGTGAALAGVGDVDRDGHADLAVAEPAAGRVWVVRGAETRRAVSLAAGGGRTYEISGLPAARTSLAGVSDVSGGGRGDLLIGSPRADGDAGRAWVVFGEKLGTAAVDVRATPFGAGIAIGSAGPGTLTGASAGGWGDTNGDGIPDLVLGTPGAFAGPTDRPGGARIVLGRRAAGALDPNATGASRRLTAGPGSLLGLSAGGTGDVNGDGLADVVVGAPGAGRHGRAASGSALGVFGSRVGPDVVASAPGPAGFLVDGPAAKARTGTAAGGAGDWNGDGASDVLLGSPGAAGGRGQADILLGRIRGTAGGAPLPLPYPAPPIGQANRSPDSGISAPLAARQRAAALERISGRASDDRTLAHVDVAVIRFKGSGNKRRCAVMRRSGSFRGYRAQDGTCPPTGFLRAKGTDTWSLKLPRRLPAGSYLILSRAVDTSGLRELAFSTSDGNRRVVTVR